MAKIITNQVGESLANELKELIQPNAKLSMMVEQFSIYAFVFLSDKLQNISHLNLLWTNQKGEDKKNIFGNPDEIVFRNQFLLRFASETCADFFESKVELKKSLPMMKMLLNETSQKFAVSLNLSDFNCSTLGLVPSQQQTLSVINKNDEEVIIDQYQSLFNNAWNTCKADVKQELLALLEKAYKDYSPEYLYQFTLSKIFDNVDELAEEQAEFSKIGLTDSLIWKELKPFQKDGVAGAIHKIKKHNGCILADSVGLGKTYQALAIIKYFLLRNTQRVLILCPKKLRENWRIYKENEEQNYFQSDNIRFDLLSHTDLSRNQGMVGDIDLTRINWGNYDLVVIDESHNFRNTNGRFKKLMDDIIKRGLQTKVLLLSATPVNNKMNDLKNQISFITSDNDSAFRQDGIESIANLMKDTQGTFNRWIEGDRIPSELIDKLKPNYFKLLDMISIARCRKHIKQYYGDEIHFPARLEPQNISIGINPNTQMSSIEVLVEEINKLKLALYSPLAYLRTDNGIPEKYAEKYDNEVSQGVVFKQIDRERSLIYLMRVNLLKRLESSITSFGLTLSAIVEKIESTLHKIERTEGYLDDYSEIPSELVELKEELSVGKKIRIELQDLDLTDWKQELEYDKTILNEILRRVQTVGVNKDYKLDELKRIITEKINNPINEGNKKILIFTAFSDTSDYLYKHISTWAQKEFNIYSALISGDGTETNLPKVKNGNHKEYGQDFNYLLTNFSPISKKRKETYPNCASEIDILIATDCVSEGQNLQDCDYLINYDIHWNPVRIVQRFGRIDRMGSVNKYIKLVNFWPMDDLNSYINLRGRVEGRSVMVDLSSSGGENIIIEETLTIEETDNYRIKQLEELRNNKDIEIDDLTGGLSMADFTFNDFKSDLYRFLKENKEEAIQTPEGIHTVLQIPVEADVEEGVIFCIKQRDTDTYLMSFVDPNGNVKVNYNQKKKLLDICKKLCSANNEVNKVLAEVIKKETKNYSDMNHYKFLFESAINGIIGKSTEEGEISLYKTGGTQPNSTVSTDNANFELITFFILRK